MGKTYTDFSINAIMGLTRKLEESNLLESFSPQCKIEPEFFQTYQQKVTHSVLSTRTQVQYNHQFGSHADETITNKKHTNNNNKKSVKRVRAKKFKCSFCWVALSNVGQYKGHLRTHTGERPYHCDHPDCNKQFTRNEELTRHKRIHSGLKPYVCGECGKGFGRRDHLKKHTKIHERKQQQQQEDVNNNVVHGDNSSAHGLSSFDMSEQVQIMTNSPYNLSTSSSSTSSSPPASTSLSPASHSESPTDLTKPKIFINQQTRQHYQATA